MNFGHLPNTPGTKDLDPIEAYYDLFRQVPRPSRRKWIVSPDFNPCVPKGMEGYGQVLESHILPREWQKFVDFWQKTQCGTYFVKKPNWIEPPITARGFDCRNGEPVSLLDPFGNLELALVNGDTLTGAVNGTGAIAGSLTGTCTGGVISISGTINGIQIAVSGSLSVPAGAFSIPFVGQVFSPLCGQIEGIISGTCPGAVTITFTSGVITGSCDGESGQSPSAVGTLLLSNIVGDITPQAGFIFVANNYLQPGVFGAVSDDVFPVGGAALPQAWGQWLSRSNVPGILDWPNGTWTVRINLLSVSAVPAGNLDLTVTVKRYNPSSASFIGTGWTLTQAGLTSVDAGIRTFTQAVAAAPVFNAAGRSSNDRIVLQIDIVRNGALGSTATIRYNDADSLISVPF